MKSNLLLAYVFGLHDCGFLFIRSFIAIKGHHAIVLILLGVTCKLAMAI